MRNKGNVLKIAGTAGVLSAMLTVSAFASDAEAIRVGAMAGPTAMGMVKVMNDAENGESVNTYAFADLLTEASAFVAPLTTGEIDIAAVPANLASVIYNNTEGGVEVLAINTLGVLNIVERGEEISSIEDLKGKSLYATGQGATPEYTLRYILEANGLDPDQDVTVQWCADTTEALSFVAEDETAIAMLPQPFVTAACAKVEGLRIALDLNEEWDKLDTGCSMVTGVTVARTEYIEEHPEEIKTFLAEYEESVAFVQENPEDAAALIEQYGIVASAAIAQKALPGCSITFIAGDEMKDTLSGYLSILCDANPKTVGGAMPGDDFYYKAE